MRAGIAFIAGFFVVFSVAATAGAKEVPKPKGECGTSFFQQYLKERGRKAFAYVEDPSTGVATCAYQHDVNTGDMAQHLALRECKKLAKKAGISAQCQIVARMTSPFGTSEKPPVLPNHRVGEAPKPKSPS